MNETKRLLVIAGGNYIYGAEKVTLDVMEGLSKEGYKVQAIISGWGNGQFAKALDQLQVKYYKLKMGWYYTSKLGWSLDSLVHYPGAVIRFLRIRKNFKDWPVYIISFRQVILLWPFFKKNIVYHVHDLYSNNRQSRFFLRIIDKKVKRYIAISHIVKQDIIQCGIDPKKIEVIHNGITVQEPLLKKNHLGNPLNIGIVGQVIRRKGHTVLIEAMKYLVEKGMDIQLIIVGYGDIEYIQELKKMIRSYKIEERVIWRGVKKNMKDIYEGIDIVAAPTTSQEPFGLISIEANMLALPVIASNSGGFKETIIDNYNGFLINSLVPEQLANKIEFFFFNREAITVLGENGRLHVKQYFEKKNMIDKISKLLTTFS